MASTPEPGGDDDSRQHVSGLTDAGVAEHPLERGLVERPDVAHDDRDGGDRGQGRGPGAVQLDRGDVEEAQQHAQRRGLGGGRHERGDRGGRALVDVGRPLMERGHRGLEGEAHDHQRQAGEHHRVAQQAVSGAAGGDRVGDAAELGRAGGAVDQRQPVDQRGRAHRADHQVLQPRLQRALAPELRGTEHVERDRQQLEPDEQGHQVLGRDEDRHAQDAEQDERVVLAMARGAGRRLPQRQDHGGDRRHREDHVEHQRQPVHRQRVGDDRRGVVQARDLDDDRGDQGGDRHQRHHGLAGDPAEQADQQHRQRAHAEDDEGHERGPVDVGPAQVRGGEDGDAHGTCATLCVAAEAASCAWAGARVVVTVGSERFRPNWG